MSHLSESVEEVEMVHEMYPDIRSYADVYNRYGLLGQEPTVMAHCIYSDDYEIDLLSKNGVFVAHNPSSNLDLGSGLMPARKFLNKGVKVGLGCDVAGGGTVSLFKVMVDALATSKIISLFSRGTLKPLNHAEIFYMAARGGGRFFGNVGCFSPGFEFDALVIDDTPLLENCYTTEERIERFTYIGTKQYIKERYVAGRHITEPSIIPL
jgi:guanine deaminase